MNSARIIITLDCPRNCSYCYNKQPKSLEGAKKLDLTPEAIGTRTSVTSTILKEYKNIVITGGEPLGCPNRTLEFIYQIKEESPKAKIYMYTSIWLANPIELDILARLDGITYSLHGPGSSTDGYMLDEIQNSLNYQDRSFSSRLWMDDTFDRQINIIPNLWDRIIKEKPREDYCPLGVGEDLYILETG